jgi:predicted transcriptional regulator of viral defense system
VLHRVQTNTDGASAIDFFARHAVFTREEFVGALDPQHKRSPRTLETMLSYHTRQGHLLRVRRGLYASVPRPMTAQTLPVDPLLIVGKLATDCVISYHSALEHHGKAYSTHREHVAFSARAVNPFDFRGLRFRTVPFTRTAGRGTPIRYGFLPQERQGVVVEVTTLERTLVDVLDRPDLAGGWEEVWRSLELVEFFEIAQAVDYALRLGNRTTNAKLGFFLETHREPLMVDDKHLERLRRLRPKQPHPMDRKLGGKLVPGWNLIVPRSILERSWEEPS